MEKSTACKCMTPPLNYLDYEVDSVSNSIGEDEYGGEITIKKCIYCGTKWLQYFVEYPAFTSSGRWCQGVVTDDALSKLSSNNALGYLESLPWYLYGGSYFSSSGRLGKGPFKVSP